MTDKEFNMNLENRFRGSSEDVSEQLKRYLPAVKACAEISGAFTGLDIGCGRGEWLLMLKNAGINATGLDLDPVMSGHCIDCGLNALNEDALSWLKKCESGSLGVITGFHVVEHIEHNELIQIFKEAYRALAEGGLIIFETPNPENLLVSSGQFYLDPTHKQPVPPELLRFTVEFAGFGNIVISRVPYGLGSPVKNDPAQYLVWAAYEYQNYAVMAQKPGDNKRINLDGYATDRVVYFDAVTECFAAAKNEINSLMLENESIKKAITDSERKIAGLTEQILWIRTPWYQKNRLTAAASGRALRLKKNAKQFIKYILLEFKTLTDVYPPLGRLTAKLIPKGLYNRIMNRIDPPVIPDYAPLTENAKSLLKTLLEKRDAK